MSLILQISALFNDYDIYKKLNTVHVCIYRTTYDNIFEVLICETDKITFTYISRVLTTVTTLKTFTITKISLDTILGPLYDREFTIKLLELTNYQLILISKRCNDIRLILRFQINENNIEIYKELSPFPEIYYKKLTDVVELIKYKMLSETYEDDDSDDEDEIIKILTNKCENRDYMIKARI
jgi:hypothetical protein